MRRFELTDEQSALLQPLLPPAKKTGRPRGDDRKRLNGLFWKLATGASWRDIPERYGPWQTVYERFIVWRDDGTLAKMVAVLQEQIDATGQLDWVQFNFDGTTVRASRAAGGARKKGGPAPNLQTMPLAAHAAALAPSCTCCVTATACLWRCTSQVGRRTSPSSSSLCLTASPSGAATNNCAGDRSGWQRTRHTTYYAFASGCATTASRRSSRPSNARATPSPKWDGR